MSRKKARWVDFELPTSEGTSWWRLDGYETEKEEDNGDEEESDEEEGDEEDDDDEGSTEVDEE